MVAMTALKKSLVLVDGSSYLFRAYYAMPDLTNSKGMPTGAIYGVINMLKRLQSDYDVTHVAVVFDPKGKTFRNDLYPDYKANRLAMPDDLRQQIAPLHEVIKALGFPLIIKDGVEADDVIGTLTKTAEKNGMTVLISTGDKDMAQLVSPDVTLVNTMTNRSLDPAGVEEKFGVAPERIIDYLALMGDTSDNIPGVPKVGPKTAAKWLNAYGSLDEVVKHAAEIKGKVGESLRDHLDRLPLSRELVTIKCDVDLSVDPSDLVMADPDYATLKKWYSTLEFKSALSDLMAMTDAAEAEPDEAPVYETILDQAVFDQWLEALREKCIFSFDTETTSLDAMRADLVGLSFSLEKGRAAYVPLAHDYEGAPCQLDRDSVLNQLKPLFSDPGVTIIGQNLKYDKAVLAKYGCSFKVSLFDTMLASYVLNSTGTRHDLDSLALKYLGKQTIHFEEIAGKGVKQLTFNQIELDVAAPYAAEDADVAWQLYEVFMPELEKEASLKTIFDTIEMPLMSILGEMERHGVLVDVGMLQKQSVALAERIQALEKKAYELAGKEFNLGSPKQLQTILYDELNIPVLKKTPGGQPSTAESVLQDLALDYPLPEIILAYRSFSKLKSTYTDRLPEQVNEDTGRIHTSYNQAVTATGRLSSNNPNLQNIPIRTEEGRKIREAFVAPEGSVIVSADYSQVELRIIADLSQDPGLLKAFKQGLDVHRATAAEVFGVSVQSVTDEQRRRAKAINFGLLYGMSAFGLSKQLGIGRHDAQAHMDMYFEKYPNVHDYMEKTRELASRQGYVETLFGRRLFIPDITSRNHQRRMAAERAAINAPMQGTAADIIKRAMINVDHCLQREVVGARMVMQVHDELVFEVKADEIDLAVKLIRRCMEDAAQLSVPLLVDIGVGENWDEAH